MAWSGHATPALIGALAAAIGMVAMWGFTVDDALIPVRYARHLAAGDGYRFNAHGDVTDGVTPLPWAFVLTPLAHASAVEVLMRAKYMGIVAWSCAAAAWGVAVCRADAPTVAKAIAFVALAACAPLGAYAVSGMETAVAMCLATLASVVSTAPANTPRARGRVVYTAAIVGGFSAAFRPEMAAWAVTLAFALGDGQRRKALAALAALLPFLACVAVRVAWFGRAAPLAILAKPSDLEHGVTYAIVAALVTGGPLLAFAPRAVAKASPSARALALAGVVHIAVVAAVGGDWMPYARLLVPIAPSLLLASVLLAPHANPWSLAARAALAIGFELYLDIVAAPAGRNVTRDRSALIDASRPYLQNAHTVAALDVGWVSAATDATIVDLAGLTDPTIAVLPGGHTSKRVDPGFLLARNPDVLVFYEPPRIVEERLERCALLLERYELTASLPLAGHSYRIYVRR